MFEKELKILIKSDVYLNKSEIQRIIERIKEKIEGEFSIEVSEGGFVDAKIDVKDSV